MDRGGKKLGISKKWEPCSSIIWNPSVITMCYFPTTRGASSRAPVCTQKTRKHGEISQVELNCRVPFQVDGFFFFISYINPSLKEMVTLKYFISPPEETEAAHLPSMVCARGVSLVQPGGSIKVKSHNQSRDTKRSATVALGIPLLRRNRHSFHKQFYC